MSETTEQLWNRAIEHSEDSVGMRLTVGMGDSRKQNLHSRSLKFQQECVEPLAKFPFVSEDSAKRIIARMMLWDIVPLRIFGKPVTPFGRMAHKFYPVDDLGVSNLKYEMAQIIKDTPKAKTALSDFLDAAARKRSIPTDITENFEMFFGTDLEEFICDSITSKAAIFQYGSTRAARKGFIKSLPRIRF